MKMQTEINAGVITPTFDKGKRIVRPADMSHKDFMFMQKAEWDSFTRIVIGRWKYDYHTTKEIEWWCNENMYGRWFHSEGHEVYYFEHENSALYFKLKWYSDLTDKKS